MMQSSPSRELVSGTRDFERARSVWVCLSVWRDMCIVRVRLSGWCSLVENDVVPHIDSRSVHAARSQSSHYHFGVFVTSELRRMADDRPVDVAFIMEDGPATTSTTDKIHSSKPRWFGFRVVSGFFQQGQIHFKPWILISSNNNTRPVLVEKKHS